VSNTIAAPSQPGQRAKRGGPAGRQLVGEYVGEPAGQAAQAVRRSGLRPGLDRSFDCAPELVGRVVAQDPPAGSELGRNGLVTLFVAAPGAGPQDGPEAPPANPEPKVSATVAAPAPPRRRRRRKVGLAGTERRSPSAPLSAAPSPDRSVGAEDTETMAVEITEDLRDFGAADIAQADRHPEDSFDGNGVPDEEFVIYADDVFAGRARPVWRRAFPCRQGGRSLRSRFPARQRLVKAALALLVVWMAVALAAALAGSPASRHRTGVVPSVAGRAEIDSRRPPALASIVRRPGAEPPQPRRKRPDAERPSRLPARRLTPPAVVSSNAETSKRASLPIPVPTRAAPPPTAASAPRVSARQKTAGGLFSP
jgi:hypothetical protein